MGGEKRILIVDDEVSIVKGLVHALRKDAITVFTASDGRTGLDIVRREKPDLVILDILMPKMNGYEVCREIKWDPELKHIPVMMLSARKHAADRRWALEIQADAYLVKPFEMPELAAIIRKLLSADRRVGDAISATDISVAIR